MEPKRLNKFISDTGFCSRREADTLIEQGRVTVNGKIPDAGTKVTPKDKVRIDDEMLRVREEKPVFLVLNKPANMSATSDQSVRANVVRAVNYPATLEPTATIEREAEGIIFLSNDEEFVRLIKRSDNKFEKEYVVTVDKLITPEFLHKLSGGSPEPGEDVHTNQVSKEHSTRFRIVLRPGTDHYLKRLCENLGYKVVHLQRLRFGNITVSKMPSGQWRTLTASEIEELVSIARAGGAGSSKRGASSSRDGIRSERPAFGSGAKSGRGQGSRTDSSGKRATPGARSSTPGKGNAPKGRENSKGGRTTTPGRNNAPKRNNKSSSSRGSGR